MTQGARHKKRSNHDDLPRRSLSTFAIIQQRELRDDYFIRLVCKTFDGFWGGSCICPRCRRR